MEPLQIEKSAAIKAYNAADKNGKELLKHLFGDQILPMKITDRIKTYEDACEVLGLHQDELYNSNDSPDERAYKKLKIIIKALNEGWTPDWTNANQYKWYPFFQYKSGFGFSRTSYAYWRAITNVGSRLCFKSEELAAYAGRQFQSIYNEFLTL